MPAHFRNVRSATAAAGLAKSVPDPVTLDQFVQCVAIQEVDGTVQSRIDFVGDLFFGVVCEPAANRDDKGRNVSGFSTSDLGVGHSKGIIDLPDQFDHSSIHST